MKRILLPVDGSDTSTEAARLAISSISERSAAPELHIVTVQTPILSGNVTRFFSADALDEYYQHEGQQALKKAKDLLQEADVPYEEHVLVGPVAQTLAEYAQKHQCDHIIMGTRGLGAMGSFMLGSVATRVLGLVKIPVTLVP